ncbi:hypothetical protein D3C71_22070 [compost metagenome]
MTIIRLHDLLGLKELPANGLAWHDLLVQGLPPESLEAVARYLGVEESDVAHLVLEGQAPAGARLSAHASNFLYRIAKALRELEIALGGRMPEAALWLRNPQVALKGRIPILLLQTQIGADFVLAAISRMKPVPKPEPGYLAEADGDDDEAGQGD